ncbi:Aste57867_23828 [Aphanomyces stellatus]|uniref:Aste57867_23828 protein n=1 Tax=Aphanomyces stellatus TaxID=120398 RepID=A0A485LNV1_9STRA|nr:hypothetical protein As57867_023755 [Aphanomyces stellatus]VFU00472.1 Aste57867_23828 [Aphanomyces stellatus]
MGNSHGSAKVAPQEHRRTTISTDMDEIDMDSSLARIAIPWHSIRLGTRMQQTQEPWISINKSWCIGPNYMTRVVVKQVDTARMDNMVLAKEVTTMQQLHHPNLVQFVGVTWHASYSYVVTECLELGELRQCLRDVHDHRVLLRMLQDIARGMSFLHAQNPPIIHRALHSANIHVSQHMRAKIANYECGRFKTLTPPPPSTAPEVVAGGPCTEKVDVFGFGVVMSEMFSLHEHPLLLQLHAECVASDPQSRPAFPDVLRRLDVM